MYSQYIDENEKEKGFQIVYGGGDFCEPFWKSREVLFDFYCDDKIDFEVRTMIEDKCTYHFKIYTYQACHLLSPAPNRQD